MHCQAEYHVYTVFGGGGGGSLRSCRMRGWFQREASYNANGERTCTHASLRFTGQLPNRHWRIKKWELRMAVPYLGRTHLELGAPRSGETPLCTQWHQMAFHVHGASLPHEASRKLRPHGIARSISRQMHRQPVHKVRRLAACLTAVISDRRRQVQRPITAKMRAV